MPTFDLADARLIPASGSGGWVWRATHAAGYVSGDSEWGVVGLLAACEGASSPEEVLGRVITALSGGEDQQWPPFTLVTAAPSGGVTVVVHGPGDVLVERKGGDRVRVAAEGRWSVHVVSGVRRLRLGAGAPPRTSLADLRTGVMPAGGAIVIGADVGDDLPPLDDPPLEPQAAYDVTSVAERPAATESGGGGPTMALIWDSGESDLLAGDAVVGRDPSADPAVKSGTAAAVVPRGRSEGMSRIHAEIVRSGWELLVSDKGSTNGTFVWDDDHQEWHRLERGERYPLHEGSIVAFGERTATVEPASAE
jgi:hypothetical protein